MQQNLPSSSSSYLRPFAFNLKDFQKDPALIKNEVGYDIIKCTKKTPPLPPLPNKTVKIRVISIIGNGATVWLKRTGQPPFQVIPKTTSDTNWIDITGLMLDGNENHLQVDSQVAWVNSELTRVKRWQRRVRFEIMVDGIIIYAKSIDCQGCNSATVINCIPVNKNTGQAFCTP